MNNIKSIISTVVLFLCVGSVSAQHRITGRVYDDIESIPLANVVERDANNRIVEATVTDMNGNFNIPLSDPTHSERVQQLLYSVIKSRIYKNALSPNSSA